VVFRIDVKCNEEYRTITTRDLVAQNNDKLEAVHFSSEQEQAMLGQDLVVTIAKLSKGQELRCECIAMKGIGKEHAKWSPVCVATYAYDPVIKLNNAKLENLPFDMKEKFVNLCPTKVYVISAQSQIVVDNREACMFCDECVDGSEDFKEKGEKEELVSVTQMDNRFIFTVETNGSLRPEKCVEVALQQLEDKLLNLSKFLTSDNVGE